MAFGQTLKDFLLGAGFTVAGTGLAGVVDYLFQNDREINYPFEDVAAGSGMVFGYSIATDKAGSAAASMAGFFVAISPDVARIFGGDASAGINIVGKSLAYFAGSLFGYVGGRIHASTGYAVRRKVDNFISEFKF